MAKRAFSTYDHCHDPLKEAKTAPAGEPVRLIIDEQDVNTTRSGQTAESFPFFFCWWVWYVC